MVEEEEEMEEEEMEEEEVVEMEVEEEEVEEVEGEKDALLLYIYILYKLSQYLITINFISLSPNACWNKISRFNILSDTVLWTRAQLCHPWP